MGRVKYLFRVKPINQAGYGDVDELLVIADDVKEAYTLTKEETALEFPVTIRMVEFDKSEIIAIMGQDL